ncbi:hypothetical protein J4G33_04360 [Actinotalea sp. BY-33]|uniref:Uncharacterized protein n=1 Tax=Actinotalea soli TaxID=2819234 RepID=A0A939RU86_9CELL|nr:hypothetical protein [Actinotalea soli]MBO1751030.1 hypothetical protein [Actinotalea soli]
MNDDQLHRLAHVQTPRPTVQIGQVEQRARALRRRHRATVGAGTAALATALVVGGVSIPGSLQPGGSSDEPVVALALGAAPARAADAGKDCDTGTAAWAERSTWAQDQDVLGAASLVADAPWPLTGVGVHEETGACLPAAPVAVLVDTAPVRGITVWADVAEPWTEDTEGVAPSEVRGVEGQLRTLDASSYATWTEDGVLWMASGSGLPAGELLEILDGLELDQGQLAEGSVPPGFDVVQPGARPTELTTTTWWVRYGDTEAVEGEDQPVGEGVDLEVTASYREPPEVAASHFAEGVRFAEVDGARATFAPMGDPATDVGGWLRWQRDGLTYTVVGTLPMEELLDLARSVEPVDVTEPEVIEAPDLF